MRSERQPTLLRVEVDQDLGAPANLVFPACGDFHTDGVGVEVVAKGRRDQTLQKGDHMVCQPILEDLWRWEVANQGVL